MNLRSRFPIFKTQASLVYLDSASTAQRVDSALEAMNRTYTDINANVHRGLYPLSERATAAYEAVRDVVQDFLNAESKESIVFTRGTTEGLNIVAQGWGGQFLKTGDEVLLTMMEHHSNIVPWQLVAKKTGAVLKFCPLTEAGDLDYVAFENLLTRNVKMVSLTGLSNVLGTVVDLPRVVALAKKVGALVTVDAAQLTAHFPIDVQKLDIDFLAFSSHKLYGPTGAGVLYGKRELLEKMDPWLGGGDMIREVTVDGSTWNDLPWKFEAGTPAIAEIIGMGAALQFVMEVGFDEIAKHDLELQNYAFAELKKLPYVQVLGPQQDALQRGCFSFVVKDVHPHDVASILGDSGVCVRAGHHCAMPLMKALGVSSTSRVSFGLSNTLRDVDALIEGLVEVAKTFRL